MCFSASTRVQVQIISTNMILELKHNVLLCFKGHSLPTNPSTCLYVCLMSSHEDVWYWAVINSIYHHGFHAIGGYALHIVSTLSYLSLLCFCVCCIDKLDEIFSKSGYRPVSRSYVQRRTINKKEDVDVPRIFVQGRYEKASHMTKSSEPGWTRGQHANTTLLLLKLLLPLHDEIQAHVSTHFTRDHEFLQSYIILLTWSL